MAFHSSCSSCGSNLPEFPQQLNLIRSPPVPPTKPVHTLILSTNWTGVTTTTPPSFTFPGVNINQTIYSGIRNQGELYKISTFTLRDFLMNPLEVPQSLWNLYMVVPGDDGPKTLRPAHIPSLQDVDSMSKVAGIVLRWWTQRLAACSVDRLVIPAELQFLSDPEPVLPGKLYRLLITEDWVRAQYELSCNNVTLFTCAHSDKKVNRQISLSCAWGWKKGSEKLMGGLKLRDNVYEMYSPYLERFVTKDNISFDARVETNSLPKLNRLMVIMLWNSRGVARRWFRRDFDQLMDDHSPDIVVLTDTRVSKRNAEEILMDIPEFDSVSVVEALGFSGGIAILWNSLHYTFIRIGKEQRALHGVIQGAESYD
ncbi:hypothetical protein SOVF_095520 [Spinacia oleracea]|uniref:Uncharacterized protein n=1 Tax=Spinacia oleracea TaxID=3562 RepID=A0A9R0K1B9_SPIOL|nr:uncharacterized protein LOC110793432 [Spinacia oleracea]KNA15732.1 hypothetical protein SOVF_095520 [Spinacia oleracea]